MRGLAGALLAAVTAIGITALLPRDKRRSMFRSGRPPIARTAITTLRPILVRLQAIMARNGLTMVFLSAWDPGFGDVTISGVT